MSSGTPQKKSSVLIEDINNALRSGRKPDEFTIKRWERDAESVRKSGDQFGYYQLMGMISQIRGDLPSTKEFFQAAVRLEPNEPFALSNYGIALSLVRDYEGALEYSKKVYRIGRELGNKSIIEDGLFRSLIMCCRLGRFIEASELADGYEPFQDSDGDDINLEIINTSSQFMIRNGISDDDVNRLVAMAYDIYRSDYTHDSQKVGPSVIVDNVEALLQIQVPVDGDALYASELNDQLFDAIIQEQLDAHLMSTLSCTFVPVK